MHNVTIVFTEDIKLNWKDIFMKEMAKLLETLKKAPMKEFQLHEHFDSVVKDFVLPFLNKL